MTLSSDLISQFVKITNDNNTETKKESIVYGTIVEYEGTNYARIDGSDRLTPISSTANAKPGERVTIMIKNHTATVTGNSSSPAARTDDVKEVEEIVDKKISDFNIVVANKVSTEELEVERGRIDSLQTENVNVKERLTAAEADIDTLEVDNVTIKEDLTAAKADIENLKTTKLDAEIAEITYATIDNLSSTNANVYNLQSTYADFASTTTDTLSAVDASIKDLKAKKLDADTASITYATISSLEAATADITNLEGTFSDFEVSTANKFSANEASIADLQANKLSATDIEGKFANIDFSNIGKAAMEYFYANSGLIENVVVGNETISGQLVGVTISGDLIEGNTIIAEKLVIKGTDGLYYKLNTDGVKTEAEQTDYNSINGQVIKAKSITASKIAVEDLVAFDATIGGFNITNSSIYSGVKTSVDNTTSGIYLDKDGQMALGDSSSFIKYYKDQNGDYHLEISAQSVMMSTSTVSEESGTKTIEEAINEVSETATTTAYDLANYISTTNSEIENLQDQIDGSITTWFYEYAPTNTNAPASGWTTTNDKNIHLGDLFYNTVTGYCYRWQVLNNVYSWNLVKDVDVTKALADAAAAQDTADNKRRVFVGTPTTPYDIGDLWVQGSSGDILRCATAKSSSQSYSSSDWVKASKYTDDTKANAAQTAANNAQSGVDALEVRMSSAETEIAQNKQAISLRATKTEVTETLSGYYTKEQADSALTVKANEITSNVSATYATKTALDTTNSNVTAAQNAADKAQQTVDDLEIRVTNAETNISQNSEYILLQATKTEVATAKTEAINTAASDATTKANDALTSAKSYADAQIKIESDRITSAVSRISANETAISTLEQTADGLEVRLDTTDANVTTAQNTANTANTTANSVKTDLANNYTKKSLPDTRNDNQAPSWYFENYPKQIITEFKYCSKIGLTGVGTYCTLQTIVPWNDSSGGYPKQTAKVEGTGKEFWRVGTSATAWSDWIDAYGLASTANSTANTAKTNAANAAKTATNFLSYDSTNGLLVGNKTSGSWSGVRAQIKSDAFNVLDQNGVTLASYGTTTTIGKTSGNNVYIDSDSIDIRRNGKVLATFDQYGLKIANTNDSSGSLGSGTTKPALVIGTPTGYHIEMDNNEIMAKSDTTTSSHLFLNMEGGNVSFNNNAGRAMMFQEGALYAKNSSYYNGEYLGILDALNDAGNTTLGYGGYNNNIGGTNIYGNSISLVSNGDINVEASWIRCRSIAPNDHATYALGVYGEKGWSNIYLGKGDNKTNALHIINGSSTYLLCGVNSSGQYVFGNNAAVMYYQAKDVGTDNTGNSFKITSGNNTASNNTNSVWLFGGADTTSRYIGSYMAYSRTYSSAANMCVTANGVFGRSTSSSERYKNSIIEADISELKSLYDMPVKKFKYNDNYIASDDELYGKYLYGFIVEDLEDILPCAVQHITDEDGTVLPEMWNSNIIIPALLKLIQDLNSRVKILEENEV